VSDDYSKPSRNRQPKKSWKRQQKKTKARGLAGLTGFLNSFEVGTSGADSCIDSAEFQQP
jgi:hypothetical protein